jgi:cell division inhibitor SepF
VTVTTATSEEASSPTIVSRDTTPEQDAAPSPAWGRQEFGASVG